MVEPPERSSSPKSSHFDRRETRLSAAKDQRRTTNDQRLVYIVPTSVKRFAILLALLLCILPACNRGHRGPKEYAYVSAPQSILRDQVAAVYNKTGVVKNGDRVQVLDRDRRFVRVRTDANIEGWIEQRNLVSQQVFDQLQTLAQQNQNTPVQGTGTTRNDTNIHDEPGRDTDHLYLLSSGSKVSLLKRATAERNLPGAAPAKSDKDKEAAKPLEDWWLIRDAQNRVGWVLGRLIDVDVPLEIAQYAEGQRIIAFFVLDEVTDADKKISQYLVLLNENKDGMPYRLQPDPRLHLERAQAPLRNRLPRARFKWRAAGDLVAGEFRQRRHACRYS